MPPGSLDKVEKPVPKVPKEGVGPSKEERKSEVFMSGDQLKVERAKCSVALKSKDELVFPATGGKQSIKLALVGGRQCVKGVSLSRDWIDVSSVTETGELTVLVVENEDTDERTGEIFIANTGISITIHIRQAPSTEEFLKVRL